MENPDTGKVGASKTRMKTKKTIKCNTIQKTKKMINIQQKSGYRKPV